MAKTPLNFPGVPSAPSYSSAPNFPPSLSGQVVSTRVSRKVLLDTSTQKTCLPVEHFTFLHICYSSQGPHLVNNLMTHSVA